jgi:PAS domain S-box-containing protein
MKLVLGKKLIATFSLAVLVLLVINVVSRGSATRLLATAGWVTHSHETVAKLETISHWVERAETAQRDFLILGEARYLEPYDSALRAIDQAGGELRTLTIDNPNQQQQLSHLLTLIHAWRDKINESIALRRQLGVRAPLPEVLTGAGAATANAIHDVIGAMEREEQGVLKLRIDEVNDSARWAEQLITAGNLLALALVALSSVAIYRDIVRRERAEEALRAAEQRFRTLVEQLPAITYVAALDSQSSTIYTSPQIETMLGFSQTEWMADHNLWHKQLHPDDHARVMADMVLSQSTGVPVPSEYRMLTRSGHVQWFRDQAVIVHDPAEQPLFMQGIMFDITERKLTEAALRVSESRNRALLDAMPDSIFRLSREGMYLDVRADNAGDLLLPLDMLLGRLLSDALPSDVARQWMACIEQTLLTETVQFIEYQLVLEQIVQDFEARVVVCAENEVLAIVRNITDRKNIERMKNEFISTVSHELRTPLTSICGALGLIVGGIAGEIPPKALLMVEIASKNSERLIRLINDILDIDKIESGKMVFNFQPVELTPLLEHVIDMNRAYGQQFDITFKLESSLAGAWVYADSDRLIQALTNLLSNAAKFSPIGAQVLVSLTRRSEMLRIAIQDRGPGIPEAFRARLFQRFAQADASDARQKGGTGLGLNITKAIVEKLGGQIDVMILPEAGSMFFIDLPEWFVLDPLHSEADLLGVPSISGDDAQQEASEGRPGADQVPERSDYGVDR